MPLLLTAGAANTDPAKMLAGRYYRQFGDELIGGKKYTGKNIVEIVPVAPMAAYVRLHLDYYNGHQCGFSGVATSEGNALVYRDPQRQFDGKICVLHILRSGKTLSIDDEGSSCSSYCGVGGTLSHVQLPYASKRPIRYLTRLKASRQYREAIGEWLKEKE